MFELYTTNVHFSSVYITAAYLPQGINMMSTRLIYSADDLEKCL